MNSINLLQDYIKTLEGIQILLSGAFDSELFEAANQVCIEKKGKDILVRGILEFSSYCSASCVYCGMNKSNQKAERFRLSEDEIIETVLEAYNEGYKTIVLQSGEDKYYTEKKLVNIIKGIKAKCPISITISVGERPYNELFAMRKAGADRYLLKHETADSSLYEALHPGDFLEDRVACLNHIKRLGYETGGGFMIGLPGQSLETIAKDLFLIKEIGCDMAGIGPFIPNEETPLGNSETGSPILTRRAVAIARLLLPDANLPATTSLGVIDPKERDLIFESGANVIMRKVTPWSVREKYEIYPTHLGEKTSIKEGRIQLNNYIKSLGKNPV